MNVLFLVVEEIGVGNGAVEIVPCDMLVLSADDRPFAFITPYVISVVCCFITILGMFDVVNAEDSLQTFKIVLSLGSASEFNNNA